MAAAIITKNANLCDVRLTDVIPRALGIESKDHDMSTILTRNRQVPCLNKDTFVTVADNQTCMEIKVFEGESLDTRKNHLIGQFRVDGIPKKPARQAKVDITFDVNMDGILFITAEILNVEDNEVITTNIDLHGKHLPPDYDKMVENMEQLRQIDLETKQIEEKCVELEKLCEDAESGNIDLPLVKPAIDKAYDVIERAQNSVVSLEEMEEIIMGMKKAIMPQEKDDDNSEAKKMKLL